MSAIKTYYVYMMTNTNHRVLYIGVTSDLVRRAYEHKHHLDSDSFTDQYNVTELVYYEWTTDAESAIAREKQLKGWTRRKKEALIHQQNPQWQDLYPTLL